MNSNSERIKEFLVSLGFEVDADGVRKFDSAIARSTTLALGLGAAAVTAAAAVVAGVAKIASTFEDLYYASQRIGATVLNLEAVRYAAEQIGLAGGESQAALEAFASALRLNPGMEGWLNAMGVITQIEGKARDTTAIVRDFITVMKDQPFYISAQIASQFGISERMLFHLMRWYDEFGDKEDAYRKKAAAWGVDLDNLAEKSKDFMNRLRDLRAELDLLFSTMAERYMPVADKFVEVGQNLIKLFRDNKGAFDPLRDGLEAILALLNSIINLLNGEWSKAWQNAGQSASKFSKLFAPSRAYELADDELRQMMGPERPNVEQESWVLRQRRNIIDWFKTWGGKPDTSQQPPEGGGILQRLVPRNNPGNLRSWGETPVEGGFARFGNAAEGLSAMAANLMAYGRRGVNTLESIANRWAPSSENNTGAYIKNLSDWTGYAPDQRLDLNDPEVLRRLMPAITRQEQGRDPFEAKMYDQAIASRSVQLSQKTEIKVMGADNPAATARSVADEQQRVNSDLVRNMVGAVR